MVYQTNGSLSLGITITREDIDHHGIVGQKHGVRNGPPYPLKSSQHSAAEKAAMKQTKREERDDNKTRRKYKREAAASLKNLKDRGEAERAAQSEYKAAEAEYKKVLQKFYLKKKTRIEAQNDASKKLSIAGNKFEREHAEYLRAERIYDQDAKELVDQITKMNDKYGGYKAIGTKEIQLGNEYTKSVIKPGLTFNNFPVLGRRYRGNYIADQESKDRRKNIDEKSSQRWSVFAGEDEFLEHRKSSKLTSTLYDQKEVDEWRSAYIDHIYKKYEKRIGIKINAVEWNNDETARKIDFYIDYNEETIRRDFGIIPWGHVVETPETKRRRKREATLTYAELRDFYNSGGK